MSVIQPEGSQFRLRAALLFEHEGQILLHRLEGDPFWALPGGRVESGETATQAAKREMLEELGIEAEIGQLVAVVENFFAYGGQAFHEICMVFSARLSPDCRLLSSPGPFQGCEGNRPLTFDWFSRARLRELDMRPACLAQGLASEGSGFMHLVNGTGV